MRTLDRLPAVAGARYRVWCLAKASPIVSRPTFKWTSLLLQR
jgi:hypothetical protein